MAFDYYRKYRFPNDVKTVWEAKQIVEEAEKNGNLHQFFQRDWFKTVDQTKKSFMCFVKKHTGY